MTEALEKWVKEISGFNDSDPHMILMIPEKVLTAFVKEVERLRDEMMRGDHRLDLSTATIRAFNYKVRDFGLDGDKP